MSGAQTNSRKTFESKMRRNRASKIAWRICRDTLVGVVITVAVAYSIVLVALPASMAFTFGVSTHWVEAVPEHWPKKPQHTTLVYTTYNLTTASMRERPAWIRLRQGLYEGTRLFNGTVSFVNDQQQYAMDQVYVGWPYRTMTHRGPDDARPDAHSMLGNLMLDGVRISDKQGGRYLPLLPIWRTFIPNVVIFAFLFELLLLCKRLNSKRIRSKRSRRGLCIQCRYELNGLETCPECGTARA